MNKVAYLTGFLKTAARGDQLHKLLAAARKAPQATLDGPTGPLAVFEVREPPGTAKSKQFPY